MSTPKDGYGDSDRFAAVTRQKIQQARAAADQGKDAPTIIAQLTSCERVLEELMMLLGRGDGWMRWTATRDQKTIYMKYKFTSYRFPNHYVLVSGPIHDIALLVSILLRKCERVDDGSLLPTPDRPYDHPGS